MPKSTSPDNVLRTHRNENFKTVSCAGLDDKRLTYRAKGVFMYLITRPDGWKFYREQVIKMSLDGRESVKTALRELRELGYLKLTPFHDGKRLVGYQWDVSEVPMPDWIAAGGGKTGRLENRSPDPQPAAKQAACNDAGNTIQDNTIEDDTTTKEDVTPGTTTSSGVTFTETFELSWTKYPKRLGGNNKRAAFKAWNTRLKKGATTDEMYAGTERYAAFIRSAGKEGTEYVLMAATFYGPNQHYLESWSPAARSSPALVAKDTLGPGRRF